MRKLLTCAHKGLQHPGLLISSCVLWLQALKESPFWPDLQGRLLSDGMQLPVCHIQDAVGAELFSNSKMGGRGTWRGPGRGEMQQAPWDAGRAGDAPWLKRASHRSYASKYL